MQKYPHTDQFANASLIVIYLGVLRKIPSSKLFCLFLIHAFYFMVFMINFIVLQLKMRSITINLTDGDN